VIYAGHKLKLAPPEVPR